MLSTPQLFNLMFYFKSANHRKQLKYSSSVTEECRDKTCGFNQRCLVNNRGKARCVCPKYCKNRYMPVCGETNGRHYWNRCYLRKDECRSQQRIGFINGPCKSKSRSRVYRKEHRQGCKTGNKVGREMRERDSW